MSAVASEQRRFHLHERIGTGGFGDVYRATLISGGGVETMVAIKVLHKGKQPKGQALQRLRDEGKMLGHLRHPAIVKVMDLVELDGRAALVAEYVEGVDIGVCFRQGGLGPRALVGIIAQIASALDAAFTAPVPGGGTLKLVHRDVKPENIRIGRQGDIKLLDFGIAKAAGIEREARTEAGDVVGSYRYMAPERLARSHEDSPEGDVYSLAAVLYEGLAGERLFAGRDLRGHVTIASDAMAHNAFISERLGKLERFGPVVQNLLSACLNHDPRLRPSASKMAAICDDLTDTLPGKNLRQWMRAWAWPDEDRGPGPLTGRTIVERSQTPEADKAAPDNITVMVFDDDPTIEANQLHTKPSVNPLSPLPEKPELFKPSDKPKKPRVSEEKTVPRAPSAKATAKPEKKRRGGGMWLGFGLFSLVVLGGSAVTGVLGALALYNGRSGSTPEEEVRVADVTPPAPAPVEEPATVDEPGEDEAPEDTDAPAEPEPSEATEPDSGTEGEAPVEAATGVGTLAVEGKVPVELRRKDQALGPGEIPLGAWAVWADWGHGFVKTDVTPVVIFDGTAVLVRCNKLKQQCETEVSEGAGASEGEGADGTAEEEPAVPG